MLHSYCFRNVGVVKPFKCWQQSQLVRPKWLSTFKSDESSAILDDKLRGVVFEGNVGKVLNVFEGIATVQGLKSVKYGDIVDFEHQLLKGLVVSLEEGVTKVAILGNDRSIYEGELVMLRDSFLNIPTGDDLLGRVIDPTGKPLDDKGEIKSKTKPLGSIFGKLPGLNQLKPISRSRPLFTGVKILDLLHPIGLGLVTAFVGNFPNEAMSSTALDIILAQKHTKDDITRQVYCIYVGIGKNRSSMAQIIQTISEKNAMPYSVVVATTASDSSVLQYLAPYVGATIAETFRDSGRHSLVVYDDLSKHALAYKQMYLSLKRPLGPDSLPPDMYYLHARLLERSGMLIDSLGSGSTSVIAISYETNEENIKTTPNLLAACDNPVKFDSNLYRQGLHPPVVFPTRITKLSPTYQSPVLKKYRPKVLITKWHYDGLVDYADAQNRLGKEIDEESRKMLRRWQSVQQALYYQPECSPVDLIDQALSILAVSYGYFDRIELDQIEKAEASWINHIRKNHPEMIQLLSQPRVPDDRKLHQLCSEFMSNYIPADNTTK